MNVNADEKAKLAKHQRAGVMAGSAIIMSGLSLVANGITAVYRVMTHGALDASPLDLWMPLILLGAGVCALGGYFIGGAMGRPSEDESVVPVR